MTDSKALREKLEQLIRQQPLDLDEHDSDCRLRDDSPRCSCGLAEYRIAFDLLRKKEERETPGTADALKRCVWMPTAGGKWSPGCSPEAWDLDTKAKVCPGCGHPVQVKQEEEEV